MRDDSDKTGAPAMRNGRAPTADTIRVLLIDDDADHTNLMREFLNEASGPQTAFTLQCADRLSSGANLLASGKPDIVILGLNLPDSRGLDTFFRFRSQCPGLPVVALTDVRYEGVALEAMRQGAQDYLIKGTLDARLLKHVIRYAMMEARLENAVQRIRSVQVEAKQN